MMYLAVIMIVSAQICIVAVVVTVDRHNDCTDDITVCSLYGWQIHRK